MFARSFITAVEGFPCENWSLDADSLPSLLLHRRSTAPWCRWLPSRVWREGIITGSDNLTLTFSKTALEGFFFMGPQAEKISLVPSLLVVGGSASNFDGDCVGGSIDCLIELKRNDRDASMIL